jgi:hypothetical protein
MESPAIELCYAGCSAFRLQNYAGTFIHSPVLLFEISVFKSHPISAAVRLSESFTQRYFEICSRQITDARADRGITDG